MTLSCYLGLQVNPRMVAAGSGRAGVLLRGRGRGRWVLGRSGRPLDYQVPLGAYPGLSTGGGDYGQFGPAYVPPQVCPPTQQHAR